MFIPIGPSVCLSAHFCFSGFLHLQINALVPVSLSTCLSILSSTFHWRNFYYSCCTNNALHHSTFENWNNVSRFGQISIQFFRILKPETANYILLYQICTYPNSHHSACQVRKRKDGYKSQPVCCTRPSASTPK